MESRHEQSVDDLVRAAKAIFRKLKTGKRLLLFLVAGSMGLISP